MAYILGVWFLSFVLSLTVTIAYSTGSGMNFEGGILDICDAFYFMLSVVWIVSGLKRLIGCCSIQFKPNSKNQNNENQTKLINKDKGNYWIDLSCDINDDLNLLPANVFNYTTKISNLIKKNPSNEVKDVLLIVENEIKVGPWECTPLHT